MRENFYSTQDSPQQLRPTSGASPEEMATWRGGVDRGSAGESGGDRAAAMVRKRVEELKASGGTRSQAAMAEFTERMRKKLESKKARQSERRAQRQENRAARDGGERIQPGVPVVSRPLPEVMPPAGS
jgi:hypothetical protein